VVVPKQQSKRFGHLTKPQLVSALQRIRGAADKYPDAEWEADVIEFAFSTTLRLSELARLTVEDADPFANRLQVAGKTGPRTLTIPENLRPLLVRLRTRAGDSGPLLGTTARISKAFRRWRDRLGVRNLHPHAIRHSAATALVDTGAELFTVQAILGHKTPV